MLVYLIYVHSTTGVARTPSRRSQKEATTIHLTAVKQH